MAVALTTSACSLQDYTYLGAGDPNTDTSDETTTEDSETIDVDASNVSTTDGTDTVDIDGSVPEAGIDDGGDATTGPDLTDQTDETDTTVIDTSDTTAVDTSTPDAGDTDTTTNDLDAGPEAPLVVEGNLLSNSSFENANALWYGFGNSLVSTSSSYAHTGVRSLLSSNRKQGMWEGPAVRILPFTGTSGTFRARAWVRTALDMTDAVSISISLKAVCTVTDDAGVVTPIETYSPLDTIVTTAPEWYELDASFPVPECELSQLDLYLEGPPAETTFYVDDVSLVRLTD